MDDREDLVRAIGAADMFELTARAFSFPDELLAQALSSGDFHHDAAACLADAGIEAHREGLREEAMFDGMCGLDASNLLEEMRVAYSLTYLAPDGPRVWLYESAFLHRASGRPGVPALFRCPSAVDVERQMREAGVVPVDVRTTPCDSIHAECAFLSYMLGCVARALQTGDEQGIALWKGRIASFVRRHGSAWFVAFFEATMGDDEAGPYAALASCVLPFVRRFCSWFELPVREGACR